MVVGTEKLIYTTSEYNRYSREMLNRNTSETLTHLSPTCTLGERPQQRMPEPESQDPAQGATITGHASPGPFPYPPSCLGPPTRQAEYLEPASSVRGCASAPLTVLPRGRVQTARAEVRLPPSREPGASCPCEAAKSSIHKTKSGQVRGCDPMVSRDHPLRETEVRSLLSPACPQSPSSHAPTPTRQVGVPGVPAVCPRRQVPGDHGLKKKIHQSKRYSWIVGEMPQNNY